MSHSLDPLSVAEITRSADIAKRELELDELAMFVFTSLEEPTKQEVLSDADVPRRARVIIRDRTRRESVDAIVDLDAEKIASHKVLPVQTAVTRRESALAEDAVRNDPRWQAAMRRRGVEDFSLCVVDTWMLGWEGPQDDPAAGRFGRPLTWVKPTPNGNAYTWPVDGLSVRIDLDTMEVVEVVDDELIPIGTTTAEYTAEGITQPGNIPYFPDGPRKDVAPLEIVQKNGPGFTLDGHELTWQKWSMRLGFDSREGLILYQVGYKDGDRVRPIVYRASLAELWVPYGDPGILQQHKNTLDMGEVGMGITANSLELGCDCLGSITYMDGIVNDGWGTGTVIPNAVCIHEEDYGIGWKHTDRRSGSIEVRRSRRLVVSFISTVGNYEYGFFWYFYQDGSIELEVKLNGIVTNGGYKIGDTPAYGRIVAPGVYAPNHQHYFSVRLDMTVDGTGNSVYECDSIQRPKGPKNPMGNAWVLEERLLERESEAQRRMSAEHARFWKVVNPSQKNAFGDPTAYRLYPGVNALPMHHDDAPALQRALFATNHLWVTQYDHDQRFAAGDHPVQSPGGEGLPEFVKGDRDLVDQDVVLWYSLGVHHTVRPEDWPVMPVDYASFTMRPDGFFLGNPALDVPASTSHATSCCSGGGCSCEH